MPAWGDPRRVNWVAFATAPDQLTAEMWRDLLAQAGLNCQLRAGDIAGFMGVQHGPVRLVAPEEQAEEARDTLQTLVNLSGLSVEDGGPGSAPAGE